MKNIKSTEQEILKGSSRLMSQDQKPFDRVQYMNKYMHLNKAYIHLSKNKNIDKEKLLNQFKQDYCIY